MCILVRITKNIEYLERDWVGARTDAERVEVAMSYFRRLLPDSTAQRDALTWRPFICGRGARGMRFGIVETYSYKPGATLYLISGGFLHDALPLTKEQNAERCAWAFTWQDAERQTTKGSLK